MLWKCLNCGLEQDDMPSKAKIRKFCSSSCHMKYSYKTGQRDGSKVSEKARSAAIEKQKKFNWLNTKQSRDKLREVMQTKEYKEKQRISKTGVKNGMYGAVPWNKQFPVKKYWEEKKFLELRKACRIRDNFCCVGCGVSGKDRQIFCDHIVPYRVCLDHELDNLQMLCGACHAKKTAIDNKTHSK